MQVQDTLKGILENLEVVIYHVGQFGYPEDSLLMISLLKSKEMVQTSLEMVLEDGEPEILAKTPEELPKQHSVGIWG